MNKYKFTPAEVGSRIVLRLSDHSVHLALVSQVDSEGRVIEAQSTNKSFGDDVISQSAFYLITGVTLSDAEFLSMASSFATVQECYNRLRWWRDGIDENGYLPNDKQNPKNRDKSKTKETSRSRNKNKSKISLELDDI